MTSAVETFSPDQWDDSENGGMESKMLDLLTGDVEDNVELSDGHSSQEDVAIWCEKCGIHNIGECVIHSGSMTIAPDNTLPTRACLSLPKILALKRVKDVDPCSLEAKRGVFSKKLIKARTMFGPMEALQTTVKSKTHTAIMEYQFPVAGGQKFMDFSDENQCNWMMFVRPANSYAQQNVTAFLKDNSIYFVTLKNIPAGTELKVWYAAAYAKAIGKRILLPEPGDVKQTHATSQKDKGILADMLSRDIPTPEKTNAAEVHTEEPGPVTAPNAKKRIDMPPVSEKSTRLARAIKENKKSRLFTCNTCNTTFENVGQLDAHICRELGEVEEESNGFGTRRRKGKPRKLLDNEDAGATASKITKATSLLDDASFFVNGTSVPHIDLISQTNDEDMSGNDKDSDSESRSIINLLPSTALIPTTAEFSGDDGENWPSSKRGPGRPKGSKNKTKLSNKVKSNSNSEAATNKRPAFPCQYCERSFTSQEQHLIHESSHTNTLPYICQLEGCGKSFSSKFKYQRHLIVHEKPNNFVCKFCPSTFSRVDHLKNHLLVHDSNRDTFTCKICGKSYLYRTTLLYHLAKHEADEGTSLVCLVCKKEFGNKEELKVHVNTHNRYKPEPQQEPKHSCSLCHKMFKTAKDIRRHLVTHSKERHFLCEHCPQTFVRKDHLRRHYTSNHKKEFYESQLKDSPFGCGACLLVFKKQEYYDYHMKSCHPNGIPEEDPPKTTQDKSLTYTIKSSTVVGPVGQQQSYVKLSKQNDSQIPLGKQQVQRELKQKPKTLIQQQQEQQQQLTQFVQDAVQPVPPAPAQFQEQQNEAYPVSLIKINSFPSSVINATPYTIISMQPAASQTPMFDSEEVKADMYSTQGKTLPPIRIQSQLMNAQALPGQVSLLPAQPETQQVLQQSSHQDPSQTVLGNKQPYLLSQFKVKPQKLQHLPDQVLQASTSFQLLQQEHDQQQQQQQQLQQQQQQTQIQKAGLSQPVSSVVQSMQMSDMFGGLANLTQPTDMAGPPNTNLYISLGSHNLIVGSAPMIDLNKFVQWTVIKEPTAMGRVDTVSQEVLPLTSDKTGKLEQNCIVTSQGQLLRASIARPDHCYATATLANPTLAQILNNPSKSQLPGQDKATIIPGPCITDEEATRIISQIKDAAISSHMGNVSNLSDSIQSQNEMLASQQQHQQEQEQLQHQQLQQLQQQQEHQQQQLQSLSSFTLSWPDNLQDYTGVAELPVSTEGTGVTELAVSTEGTALNQGDMLGAAVAASAPASWILQLPTSVLEQPHLQQLQTQHLPTSHIMAVSTATASTGS